MLCPTPCLEQQISAGDTQKTEPATADVEQARQALVDLDVAILHQRPVNSAPPAQTAPDTGMDAHIHHQMYEQVMAIHSNASIQPEP